MSCVATAATSTIDSIVLYRNYAYFIRSLSRAPKKRRKSNNKSIQVKREKCRYTREKAPSRFLPWYLLYSLSYSLIYFLDSFIHFLFLMYKHSYICNTLDIVKELLCSILPPPSPLLLNLFCRCFCFVLILFGFRYFFCSFFFFLLFFAAHFILFSFYIKYNLYYMWVSVCVVGIEMGSVFMPVDDRQYHITIVCM